MPLAPDFLEAQFGAGHWTLGALRFATGPRNTSADVLAGASASGSEKIYLDTCMVVPADPFHNPPAATLRFDFGRAVQRVTKRNQGRLLYALTPKPRTSDSATRTTPELQLTSGEWKTLDFEYLYTPLTLLEFEFKGAGKNAATGIGVGADRVVQRAATFLVRANGSQTTTGSFWEPVRTDPDGWQHYRIPLGHYLRFIQDYGKQQCIVFFNEPDGNDASKFTFRNVTLSEEE